MKFFGRAKETVENVGKGDGGDIADGSRMKDAIGYSDKKRKIALEMGTTNPVLQKQLDDLAWASWAGGFSLVWPLFQSVAQPKRHSPWPM